MADPAAGAGEASFFFFTMALARLDGPEVEAMFL